MLRDHKDWEIKWICIKSDSSYLYQDERNEINVQNKKTGYVFKTFYQDYFANSAGEETIGVTDIGFSDNGLSIEVHSTKQPIEFITLPNNPDTFKSSRQIRQWRKITTSPDGLYTITEYTNGDIEKTPRK